MADGTQPDESSVPPRYAMPEFTRALRGIAAPSGLGRPEHAGVFGPLLAARKLAEDARTVRLRVAAFDAARLERTWTESIESLAAARVPKTGADRRALGARLTELAAPLFGAIRRLAQSAERVRLAGESPDAAPWAAWIAAVQAVFDAADQFWVAIEPELGPRVAERHKKPGGAAARAMLVATLGASAAAGRAQAQHVAVSVPNGAFYGFEFPDDEAQLQQLFGDNLPFAIDAIECARDPLGYVSPTTFYHSDRIVLESVSPVVEATVPAATASNAAIAAPNPLSYRIDTATGDILAYDFSGRLIWKTRVTTGGNVPWDLNSGRVANGVYLVIARSGGKTLRLKRFVVRDGS